MHKALPIPPWVPASAAACSAACKPGGGRRTSHSNKGRQMKNTIAAQTCKVSRKPKAAIIRVSRIGKKMPPIAVTASRTPKARPWRRGDIQRVTRVKAGT